jgi:putative membrane protein
MPGREEMITMMFWYGGGWAWWQAGLMWLAMIAFWALLIWAIYALITGVTRRAAQQGGSEQDRGEAARAILDERLARGEIDAEEYRRLCDILDGGARRSPAGTGSRR